MNPHDRSEYTLAIPHADSSASSLARYVPFTVLSYQSVAMASGSLAWLSIHRPTVPQRKPIASTLTSRHQHRRRSVHAANWCPASSVQHVNVSVANRSRSGHKVV